MSALRGSEYGQGGRVPLEERLRGLSHDLPPEGLAGRITGELARMPAPRPPWKLSLLRLLDRPGFVWGYRLATLGVLAGILAGVWVLVARRSVPLAPAAPPASPAELARAVGAPPKGKLVSVTFAYYDPQATSVALVGSFNDWDPRKAPMVRGGDGNWSLQVKLPPGRYEYLFLVDGTRYETDPMAVELRPDGLGHQNAVLRL